MWDRQNCRHVVDQLRADGQAGGAPADDGEEEHEQLYGLLLALLID